MRKVFSVGMLIVGTMIGAGFCSGREIVSFFGSGISVAVAPICGLLIFLLCVLFLSIGSKIGARSFDAVNGKLLGKYHIVADFFLLVNNFIVLSAMIAGFNSLLEPIVKFPVFGAVAAAVCALIASRGAKGMLDCNFAVVPLIIVSLGAACVGGIRGGVVSGSLGVFRAGVIPGAVVYVSMNMMLASTVLTTLGKLTRKQIILSSLIASATVTALLLLIITALNCTGNYDSEMPILEISAGAGKWLYAVLAVVTGISIFTTMLTAVGGLCGYLEGKIGGKLFNSALIVIAGVIFSFIGFTRVVSLFYPLVGLFGIVYIVVCLRFVLRGRAKRSLAIGRDIACKKRKKRRLLRRKAAAVTIE